MACAAPICAAISKFVFRCFDTLLGIGTRLRPADYRDIVGQRG